MFKTEELVHAREIIDSLVEITPPSQAKWNDVTFAQKLDRLSELIDVLRFDAGCPDPENPLKTFRPNGIFADVSERKLHFVGDGSLERLDDEAPKKLMLPLLDYLFTHPGKGRSVLSIIRAFVREYFFKCHLRDFQRTATGVLRIETNVRFAARELRKIGLLQYTEEEAFKTWRLSLLGILAAENFQATLYGADKKVPKWFWLQTILTRLQPVRTMDSLISKLEGIAKHSSVNWPEKRQFLDLTRRTIAEYQRILNPEEKSDKYSRASEVMRLLVKLNETPEAEFIVAAFDGVPSEQLRLIFERNR
jgi:hypothetical protein